MKILFSPSESKTALSYANRLNSSSFAFCHLYEKRVEILKIYDEFLTTANLSEISKLFGIKNIKDEPNLHQSIFEKPTAKAILRYDGVAYKHLDYRSLSEKEQNFIDTNVLIFSNLFGPILAGDLLPEYKLKQGEKLGTLNIENFYKQNFCAAIDEFLSDELIIDLRAEFYEKFYEIKQEFFTYKFIKNGKVISHYAKAYRGKILRELAKNSIKDKNELLAIKFDGISLIDMKKIGYRNELLFEIS